MWNVTVNNVAALRFPLDMLMTSAVLGNNNLRTKLKLKILAPTFF